MKIGVCDIKPEETARTVYLLNYRMKNHMFGENKVMISSYTPDSVMMDLDDQKFDCDIFITELTFLNEKNGVMLARKINASAPSCNIIFYANKIPNELDIYEAHHVNCMLKGYHENRLVAFVDELVERLSNDERKRYIRIRYDRNVNILDCRDIMYIRIENRVTKYYTTRKNETEDGVFYEYRPLSEIMQELPDNFVRCQAAAIVNRDYVQSYNHQFITMTDGSKVKIGRRYGEAI